MGRPRKNAVEQKEETSQDFESVDINPSSLGWTDHVLSLLSEDEKIKGNPTTDGLRRIFEVALNCVMVDSTSSVVQSPSPDNEKRATVIHSISYVLNNYPDEISRYRTVSGAADVYWGNCDKVYRNHPVAVAETRAEGRALRRALRLRKVVAAEEIAENIEDHPDHDTVTKITNNQLNFMDVLAKRLNINLVKLLNKLDIQAENTYNIQYNDAVDVIKKLNEYQQQNNVSEDILGYESSWK